MSTSSVNNQSFLNFLSERGNPGNKRLYIEGSQLRYDEKAGWGRLFAANFGCGSASMSKVSEFIKKKNNGCLDGVDADSVNKFNVFISNYNEAHCCYKKAREIKVVKPAIETSDSDTEEPTTENPTTKKIERLNPIDLPVTEENINAVTQLLQTVDKDIADLKEKIIKAHREQIINWKDGARALIKALEVMLNNPNLNPQAIGRLKGEKAKYELSLNNSIPQGAIDTFKVKMGDLIDFTVIATRNTIGLQAPMGSSAVNKSDLKEVEKYLNAQAAEARLFVDSLLDGSDNLGSL